MKKGWKIIATIAMAAALLGAVCLGVGLITGADLENIFSLLDERYQLQANYEYIREVWRIVTETLM